MTVTLSNLQYPTLKIFVDHPHDYMSIEEAQALDQRPFRSMLYRQWVVYTKGKGFHISKAGIAAMREFLSRDIFRKDSSLPLTSYFDPTAYGLKPPERTRRVSPKAANVPTEFYISLLL
jgi:hypothetical protein